MEQSLKALYISFATIVFVVGITMLILMQKSFDDTYKALVEVVNGGYIW